LPTRSLYKYAIAPQGVFVLRLPSLVCPVLSQSHGPSRLKLPHHHADPANAYPWHSGPLFSCPCEREFAPPLTPCPLPLNSALGGGPNCALKLEKLKFQKLNLHQDFDFLSCKLTFSGVYVEVNQRYFRALFGLLHRAGGCKSIVKVKYAVGLLEDLWCLTTLTRVLCHSAVLPVSQRFPRWACVVLLRDSPPIHRSLQARCSWRSSAWVPTRCSCKGEFESKASSTQRTPRRLRSSQGARSCLRRLRRQTTHRSPRRHRSS